MRFKNVRRQPFNKISLAAKQRLSRSRRANTLRWNQGLPDARVLGSLTEQVLRDPSYRPADQSKRVAQDAEAALEHAPARWDEKRHQWIKGKRQPQAY